MKKIITLLALCCLPMLAAAQSLTAAQKEEALRTVTEFCSFVERFCKGERTLDTQIYALCSGRGCSTFDDIGTNSETKMENYLSAIQKTYARSLQTEISAPSLAKSKTYMEPEVGLSTQWGNFGMSELSTTMVTEADAVGISNQYIAFDVVQIYPALGKSMEKKIVYDVNNRKITAFITGGGTFISFLEGVSALTAKDYSSAVKYFDAASQNERDPAFQKRCNLLSAICCAYTLDIESAFKYAQKAGDELYIANFGHMLSLMHENFEEASKYASSLSDIIESRTDMTQYQKSCAYTMLGSFFVEAPTPYQDVEKGVAYLKRASSLGNPAAKYAIFIYQMNRLIPDEMLGDDESVKLMVEAAEMGYPPALTMAGFLEEYFRKNSQKATMWYEKAAQAGNPIGMALYGRMLMKAGNEYEAKKWLNKSLEGQGFENQIKEYELQFGAYFFPWPKSRQDVIDMLGTSSTDGGSHDGGSAYTPQVNNLQQTPANTTTQHTVSTPDVTTSHYSRKRYRKPFNEPVDDYKIAGLSVGYVSKQWQAKADGQSLKYGIWEDSKQMNGLQIGVRVEPQFKFGFGINTGLYYEFYFTKSNTLTDDYGEYTGKVHEHCLYLPIHLEYRLNFSETFQAFFYGGIGLDCGVSASFTMEDEHNDAYDITVDDVYGSEYFPDWKRFNASFEYGAGIRFKMIQLNFTAAKGLVNMSAIDEYKVYQNKNMSLSLSMMF